jgi:hypothetical protein
MNNTMTPVHTIPKWFLILAIILYFWNLLGVKAFVVQMTLSIEQISALPIAEQQLYQNIPLWVNIAFGCAVFGGALGCIALIARRMIALPLLGLSLMGVLIQMFHAFFIANSIELYGPTRTIMPIMLIVVAIFLVCFANSAKGKGWLR